MYWNTLLTFIESYQQYKMQLIFAEKQFIWKCHCVYIKYNYTNYQNIKILKCPDTDITNIVKSLNINFENRK